MRLTTCEGWACPLPAQLLPLSATDLTNQRHEWPTRQRVLRWYHNRSGLWWEKRKTAIIMEYFCISFVPQLPRMFYSLQGQESLKWSKCRTKGHRLSRNSFKAAPPTPISCALRVLTDTVLLSTVSMEIENEHQQHAGKTQHKTKQMVRCETSTVTLFLSLVITQ